MALKFGQEFRAVATPDQELQQKLGYIAGHDGPVVTGADGSKDRHTAGNLNLDELMLTITLAPQSAITRFTARLDTYDAALDLALFDLIRDRDELLADAAELPDGTKIFFSEDGTYAEDQDGNRVANESTIGMALEERATYPTITKWQQSEFRIRTVQRAQDRVANAREQAGQGNLTADELQALDDELEQTVSQSITHSPAAQARFADAEPILSDDELAAIDLAPVTPISAAHELTDDIPFPNAPALNAAFNLAADNTEPPSPTPTEPSPAETFTP